MVKIGDKIREAGQRLAPVFGEDSKYYARRLVSGIMRLSSVRLRLEEDRILSAKEDALLEAACERLCQNEPLAYVLGSCEFYDLELQSEAPVLIPRPDSEILVSEILERMKRMTEDCPNSDVLRLLEIGTGSAALPLAILTHFDARATEILSLDSDQRAVSLAQKNRARYAGALARHGHRLELYAGDFFDCGSFLSDRGPYDLIFSNPPYVSEEEYLSLPPSVKNYESRKALSDGGDGLRFYRELVKFGAGALREGGVLAVEHGKDQADIILSLFRSEGYRDLRALRDYGGRARVISAVRGPIRGTLPE